jgi:hypothetical protein
MGKLLTSLDDPHDYQDARYILAVRDSGTYLGRLACLFGSNSKNVLRGGKCSLSLY